MLALNEAWSAIGGAAKVGAYLAAFVAFFIFVTTMLARRGGWSELGAAHRRGPSVDPPRRWRRVANAELRKGTQYTNLVRMGADGEHLHLSVIWLFSVGHPPLAVPWSDVRIDEVTDGAGPAWLPRFFRGAPMVRLSMEGVPLTVPRHVVHALFEDAGMAPPA